MNMKSLQGNFLVAAPNQLDPHFVETVILVVEHDDRGAFGVIVNCPKDRHEGTARQRRTKPRWPERPRLHFGGPVTGPLMAVHADERFPEIEVLPGVFFAGREKNVRALMRSKLRPCKVFRGYTGWAPGQLEHEVQYGTWRAVPATAAMIFSNRENVWERLLRQAFDSLLQVMCNVKHIPSDASLN
jgi:putative transcriptional regulator